MVPLWNLVFKYPNSMVSDSRFSIYKPMPPILLGEVRHVIEAKLLMSHTVHCVSFGKVIDSLLVTVAVEVDGPAMVKLSKSSLIYVVRKFSLMLSSL